MTHPRDEICRLIASLSSSCTMAEVETALEPLFQVFTAKERTDHHDNQAHDKQDIAPLIVACDKGNVSCLQYLLGKMEPSNSSSSISAFIGQPLDKSPDHGNSAMHHAAMAGCFPAIAILAQMDISLTVLALGTVRNTHGDTPLMMAAAAGHVNFCTTWQELCFTDHQGSCCNTTDVQNAWKLKNDSNDSCLSLACAHGHQDVVEFLLSSACGVHPDSQEILQGQILYQKMTQARRLPSSLTQAYQDQIERVLVCIEMLQVATNQAAELAAQELLCSYSHLESKMAAAVKGNARIRPKPKKNKSKKLRQPTTSTLTCHRNSDGDTLLATKQRDVVELTTLSDGTRAVRVAGEVESSEPNCNQQTTTSASGNFRSHRSADELFRERFQQSQICAEVDSVMKALCLNMSMLLYTPHGMAIDLSPSQLDAIQDILERQLHAVNEARNIQKRLHNC